MKKFKILLSWAMFMVVSPFVKAQDPGLDNIEHLLESERYSSAELLLEENIGTNEPLPEINYLLVKTYLEQEKKEEVVKYVNKYLNSVHNEDVDPLNRIAYARYLLNSGNREAANEIFEAVADNKKNRKDPELLLVLAEVAVEEENGNAEEALKWLEMAEKKDKHNADISITRGLAYRKIGDASKAYLAYQDALKKDPRNVRAQYLLGKIFTAQKNHEVYLQHFMKAYAIDSTYAPVLEELYNHYYFRDVRIARKYLEKYIANTDYSLQNDYYMTDMLYLTGDYAEAIRYAGSIISKEQEKTKPRLYKLIAYSYLKNGDSIRALDNIKAYFNKEEPVKVIAADFEMIAQLTAKNPGQEEAAISYYSIAAEMDTINANKAGYAETIVALYKKLGNDSKQAEWLGKLYSWKKNANNVDLFNWGLAWYKAKDYLEADTVFAKYTERYPEDIYGYYWRAQANASIDTNMTGGLAIPFYHKVVEIGEKDQEAHRKMLLKAYGYLGGYEANITRNYPESLRWFEKYVSMEENAEVARYIEMLHKWIAEKKQ